VFSPESVAHSSYYNTVKWFWWDWSLSQRPTCFLQCFDAVGWVIWPVKIVPEMTYNVSSGTLSLYSVTVVTSHNGRYVVLDTYLECSRIDTYTRPPSWTHWWELSRAFNLTYLTCFTLMFQFQWNSYRLSQCLVKHICVLQSLWCGWLMTAERRGRPLWGAQVRQYSPSCRLCATTAQRVAGEVLSVWRRVPSFSATARRSPILCLFISLLWQQI